jgi:phenylalanine-4-hydroxylase
MTAHDTLTPDHPGFRDPGYRRRREAIAAIARRYRAGEPIPRVAYEQAEHAVWRRVWRELAPRHERWVARDLRDVLAALPLDRDAIPQLADVSIELSGRTGFRMAPVTGLVPPRRFFEALADGEFLSTQYVRHASRPLYTPEPDVIHELVGHAATLADPRLAAINRRFGQATRVADDDGLRRLERVYWFTLEFGVCREGEDVRAVGAGLLSSAGELDRLPRVPLHPWDLRVMATTDYDTTDYQPALFVAPSFDYMLEDLLAWLDAEILRAGHGTVRPPGVGSGTRRSSRPSPS